MQDDDYIRTPITLDTLEDPDEPGIHPLEAASRRITGDLVKSGIPVTKVEFENDAEPTRYQVTFVPKRSNRQSSIRPFRRSASRCPSCGTQLNDKGQCRACWADVFGICDTCNAILDDDHTSSSCLAAQQTFA